LKIVKNISLFIRTFWLNYRTFFQTRLYFFGGEFFNFPVYFSAKTNIFNKNISLFVPGSSLRQFCCVPRRGSTENQSCYRDSCATILYFFNHL